MSNSFGEIFKLTSFGESHGKAVGGIIDGFPSNIVIDEKFFQHELDKRKPGFSKITSQRKETDKVEILSGVFDNKSLGTPIGFIIPNHNQLSSDYEEIKNIYRPGHADYTYDKKYGHRDYRGGGRASARETASRVVGGAFAKIILKKYNIEINAFTSQIGKSSLVKKYDELDFKNTFFNVTRCPDNETNLLFEQEILNAKNKNDSIGGIISCVVKNCPVGLGEPVFNKFHAKLGSAILSINACKGFEIGSGFDAAKKIGSENNDEFYYDNNKINTYTNNAGGVLGGITNGQDIVFRASFKPTPSVSKEQKTINNQLNNVKIKINGRHDPCVVPRAVVIVEAMTAMAIADFLLLFNANKLMSSV